MYEKEDWEIEEEKAYARYKEESAAWKKKWPHHCSSCVGWGYFNVRNVVPYGMGTATETLGEMCDAIDINICHRCGMDGLNEDGEGPCSHCGWNYDDGVPEW